MKKKSKIIMGNKSIQDKISQTQAHELLQQDDYISDVDLTYELLNRINFNKHEYISHLDLSHLESKKLNYYDFYPSFLDIFSDKFDSYEVLASNENGLDLRIGSGRVFHLGKAIKTLLINCLGLFFVYSAEPGLAAIYRIYLGANIVDVAQKFLSCYEKLEKKNEVLVFELIYRLQNELCITNYDKYTKDDFNNAIGYASPTFEAIYERLNGELTEDDLTKVLEELEQRKVLARKNKKWNIRIL